MAALQKSEPFKQEEPAEVSSPKKPGMVIVFLILMTVTAVVLAEVLVGYLLLPSPQRVNAEVEEAVKKTTQKSGKVPYKTAVVDAIHREEQIEVALGEAFNITEGDVTNVPFRLSVSFSVLINKSDKDEYEKRYEANKSRIRNAVLVILRSAKQTEITDPTLGLIRNKIMVKVNEILGMPLVKEVLYTDIAVQTTG
ncbi:MAG: flagellar basal body-associated FliL family protein [Planctomycetaceae bacterium]|nr:flagellar basal body-associated FliL family protein [Planctomycetaceae bacterium]